MSMCRLSREKVISNRTIEILQNYFLYTKKSLKITVLALRVNRAITMLISRM